MIRRALGVLVAAAVAGGLLAACSATYTDGARPGQAYAGGGGTVDPVAHKAVVQLPLGPLTVEVGAPSQRRDSYEDTRAADGAKWVSVAWTLAGPAADYDNSTPAFQFGVTLVADHQRYNLQAARAGDSDDAASKYTPIIKEKALDVVVQGEGKHLKAEVEYDGVTQTVDFDSGRIHSGVAAALYAKNAPHTALAAAACPVLSEADERRFRTSPSTRCSLDTVRTTPYVGGLGWVASPEQTWTLVPLQLQLIEIDANDSEARYSNFDIRQLKVRVDGIKPTTEILRYRDADRLQTFRDGVLVFKSSSAPKTLRVQLTFRAQNEYKSSQFHTFSAARTYRLR